MLYDDNYLYISFKIEEPHIWAKLKQRDTIIYYDNDIEIFIDTDASTHNYLELEINALNTIWDLYLTKPYREGGLALNNWNFKNLKTAVNIVGTINDPSDIDEAWYVEVAIPWISILETQKNKVISITGKQMRMNFSRVQWQIEIIDGKYVKKKSHFGEALSEDNWVWSPMGAINMHMPELWGIVIFDDGKIRNASLSYDFSDEELRQVVSYVYKSQKNFNKEKKYFARNLKELNIEEELIKKYNIEMKTCDDFFEIVGYNKCTGVFWQSNMEGKLNKYMR